MSIRHIATATALLALVAASPAFAQSQTADQPQQANTVLDEYGRAITDDFGKTIQRDPEMVNPAPATKQ